MKKIYLTTLLSTVVFICVTLLLGRMYYGRDVNKTIKVGFVYIGDASTAYTYNFMRAQEAAEHYYGDSIETSAKYNIPAGEEKGAIKELVDEGCNLIFTTSDIYARSAKMFAAENPDIEFCQASADNANTDPMYMNYHTFMGEIYKGRYVSGFIAGMKLAELIEEGKIARSEAKVGYVAAMEVPSVVSGYTAFLLGVRAVVPTATMTVRYTGEWGNYTLEKKCARELIADGCCVISHHTDTTASAFACESADKNHPVYHVGYNISMTDVAPTTHLASVRIDWEPYVTAAIGACLENKSIEDCVRGKLWGNDCGGGFKEGWIEILDINPVSAPKDTQKAVERLQKRFEEGDIHVFKGNYTGVSFKNPNDTYDLTTEYIENESCSAPSFPYILNDVITVKREDKERD